MELLTCTSAVPSNCIFSLELKKNYKEPKATSLQTILKFKICFLANKQQIS